VLPFVVRPIPDHEKEGENMLDWMLMPYKRYAEFSGRSRRMEYWSFALLIFVVYLVCAAVMIGGGLDLAAMTNPQLAGEMPAPGPLFYIGAGLLVLFLLASFIPMIAVVIRRLHDRNMSGWWYLGVIVASMIPLVGILASLAFMVLMFLPGTPGPNKYGPDPKDPSGAEVFS
jgi:uncharacterized membrane protein YhaH (DUF805 family)